MFIKLDTGTGPLFVNPYDVSKVHVYDDIVSIHMKNGGRTERMRTAQAKPLLDWVEASAGHKPVLPPEDPKPAVAPKKRATKAG